jgi:hypothetical protein
MDRWSEITKNIVCPICNRTGQFGYFDSQETGIVAMFIHSTGKFETINTPFGSQRRESVERHFITLEQLEKTEWFKEWKELYDNEMKKHLEKQFRELE